MVATIRDPVQYQNVTVVNHPLIQHKLTLMRDKETSTAVFCQLLREISVELCFASTKDLPLTVKRIETPMGPMDAPTLEGKKLIFASILRAGDGMLAGMRDAIPSARVAHIGLCRDHKTLKPKEYYFKAPVDIAERSVIVIDPMLATAGSVSVAIDFLKKAGAKQIRFVCLVSAPEGIRSFQKVHSDVPIITAAIDSHLNEKGYIIPGLGDAGDRIFGTK